MSIDEQDRIRGAALRAIGEHQRTLLRLKDKAHRLSHTIIPVQQCLGDGISHPDIENIIARFPTREEIVTTLQEIDSLTKEIARLEQVVGKR